MDADKTCTAVFNTSGALVTILPTMTGWGMIIFMVLAGLGVVYYMRRKADS